MRIGILGTRGIPNHYGGFEQVAAHLALGFTHRGHEVTVYNTSAHPFKAREWHGVRIVRYPDPAFLGTAGQFLYDLQCILDARKRGFDVLLVLGYTSSSVWGWLYPSGSTVFTNMDGMEWQRAKYTAFVRRFLMMAESLAVRFTDYCVADSPEVQAYLANKYGLDPAYIAYGADLPRKHPRVPPYYGLHSKDYYLLIARMEPENNIAMILEGFLQSRSSRYMAVVGNMSTPHGKHLVKTYGRDPRIRFLGPVYDQETLGALRGHARKYFHGHSVGGTNPSLLEAMAAGIPIAAHDNPFNAHILGADACYFDDAARVRDLINLPEDPRHEAEMAARNYLKILEQFRWDKIVAQYEALFLSPTNPVATIVDETRHYDTQIARG